MALLPRVRIAANGYVDVLYKKKCLLRKIHLNWELFFDFGYDSYTYITIVLHLFKYFFCKIFFLSMLRNYTKFKCNRALTRAS